jgi:hypothetical protein
MKSKSKSTIITLSLLSFSLCFGFVFTSVSAENEGQCGGTNSELRNLNTSQLKLIRTKSLGFFIQFPWWKNRLCMSSATTGQSLLKINKGLC